MGPRFESVKAHQWPVGQAVKTTASHAVNVGSIPARVTIIKFIVVISRKVYIVSADCSEGPPVPIPNTEVKLASAENTCLETDRKDR